MENNFIPVTVWRKNKYETWQLDISNLNLSDLIILRNTLVGYSDNGIRIIDRIVTGRGSRSGAPGGTRRPSRR